MGAVAIVRLIPGHRQADYQARIEQERQAVRDLEDRMAAEMARFSEDDKRLWDEALAGRYTPQSTNLHLWAAWLDRRELLKQQHYLRLLEKEAQKPDSPDRIEFAVIYSYDIKDALKARGYRFSPEASHKDFRPVPGWVRVLNVGDAATEVEWLRGQGVEVKAENAVESLFSALALGRPELMRA